MSTDPTFTVEWTVPADEWGDDAPDDRTGVRSTRDTAHPTPGETTTDADCTDSTAPDTTTASYANRDPTTLPPAPVLAAHVDALRADREARERELDALRDRYETIIEARNEEIRELRARQDSSLLDRLLDLF